MAYSLTELSNNPPVKADVEIVEDDLGKARVKITHKGESITLTAIEVRFLREALKTAEYRMAW